MQNLVGIPTEAAQLLRVFAILAAGFITWGCNSRDEAVRDNLQNYSRSGTGSLQVEMESQSYRIKRGDSVEVNVWGYPEFATKEKVRQGGIIVVPLVGELTIEGMTKEEFQQLIKQKLAEYIHGDAKITVSVVSLVAQKVTVIGAVSHQDNFPVTSDVSIVEVISSAGGSTTESDLNHIKIIRYGKSEDPIEVDLASALENGTVDQLPKVRPGDTVFVPKNENVIREFSDFLRDAVLIFGFFSFVH